MALCRSFTALLMTGSVLALAGCATGGAKESGGESEAPAPDAFGLTARTNEAALPARYTNGLWYMVKDGEVTFIPGERCQMAGVFVADCPETTEIVDLEGAYITPGFGEAHNHSVDGPWTMGTAQIYLSQGIYYYKNPNNVGPITENFRSLWNKPDGLDVIFAHGGLSVNEGHPEKLYRTLAANFRLDPDKLDGQVFFNVETLELLEEKWSQVLAGNPDFIKLYLLDHDEASGRNSSGLSEPVFRRAVELAKEAGLRTTVHVETVSDLALAIDAGADEAAHMPGYWFSGELREEAYRIPPDMAAKAAEQGFIVVTTTNVTDMIFTNRPDPENLKQRINDLQAENLDTLRLAGVKLAVGSDTYQETSRNEVMSLHALASHTDEELLRLWVETPRLSIFPGRAIGALAPEWEASFVAMSCNPALDITCVEEITARVKQGAILE